MMHGALRATIQKKSNPDFEESDPSREAKKTDALDSSQNERDEKFNKQGF